MDGYNYTLQLDRIADALESIRDTLSAGHQTQQEILAQHVELVEQLSVLNETQAGQLAEQRRWISRAVDERVGIVMRGREDHLSRATTIAALRETGRLDTVLAEMNAPTPLPTSPMGEL